TNVFARVQGGVRPRLATDAEEVRPFPFVLLDDNGTSQVSDWNGVYAYSGHDASSALLGAYIRSTCNTCSNPGAPLALAGSDGVIDFGTGGVNQNGNGTSTPAD